MAQVEPKQVVYTNLAEIAHGIAHPHRLELLEYLTQGQISVEGLARLSGLTIANTSRHLQILRRAHLVETERQGKYILYRLAGRAEVIGLLKALGGVVERNRAEVQQVMQDYFSARDALAPVSREELVAKLRDESVTLIDVRPEHEFATGHLPGALNIPLASLKRRLSSLSRKQEVVAYCRGPYCVLSVEAVALLHAEGFRVRRLEDGLQEWQAAGHAVETRT